MPVSTNAHLTYCTSLILRLQPKSVLDVGCGFGLWGFLCREYLDVFQGRVRPEKWRTRIDGIEVFEPYLQTHQRALYDSLHVGDIRDLAPELPRYDLIIAGDVIEHLEKDEGEAVLDQLSERADIALLVNIPLGEGWEHPEQHSNPAERHRSTWCKEDFYPYGARAEIFDLPCGAYGVFLCLKDDSPAARARALVAGAEHYLAEGRLDKAKTALLQARALDPACGEAALMLADGLIAEGAPGEAASVLEQYVRVNPGYHHGRVLLAELYTALALRDKAREHLEVLFAVADLPSDTRRRADALRARL